MGLLTLKNFLIKSTESFTSQNNQLEIFDPIFQIKSSFQKVQITNLTVQLSLKSEKVYFQIGQKSSIRNLFLSDLSLS